MFDGSAPTADQLMEMQKIYEEPKVQLYGLRNPERDANTEADYMRISFKEEDEAFMTD